MSADKNMWLSLLQSFYNPINETFQIPRVGGQSYSFTDDGYWEQALFVFTADRELMMF